MVFDSRSRLEDYVEVPDVDVGTLYDAHGRLLRLRVAEGRVVVEEAEPVATHQDDLINALRQALRAVGKDPPVEASLGDLVALARTTFG